jgi:hypothetical protein
VTSLWPWWRNTRDAQGACGALLVVPATGTVLEPARDATREADGRTLGFAELASGRDAVRVGCGASSWLVSGRGPGGGLDVTPPGGPPQGRGTAAA